MSVEGQQAAAQQTPVVRRAYRKECTALSKPEAAVIAAVPLV